MTYPYVPVVPSFKSIIGYQRNAQKLLGVGDLRADAWGIQKVSIPHSLFHGIWTFNIPSVMWFMYENGTQVYAESAISSVAGVARIQTGGLVTSALLESRETPRYQPNRGHLFSTALWMPEPLLDATRDFGLFTTRNGVFFRLKSDGKLYAVLRSAGITVREELIDLSGLADFDVAKSNIYDIQFQWRSAGNYYFYIGDPAIGASRLVHVFDNLGTLTSASIEDPALPAAFSVSAASGVSASMYVGCADITTENGEPDVYQYESAFAETVTVNGINAPVIVVHNPLTISAKPNTRGLQLARISVTCSKKASFKVWMGRNPAAIIGATLQTVNNGSYVQVDSPDKVAGAVRATAINTALLRNVTLMPVEALATREVDNPSEHINFAIVRGDYLVITCTASQAIAECVVEWGESI